MAASRIIKDVEVNILVNCASGESDDIRNRHKVDDMPSGSTNDSGGKVCWCIINGEGVSRRSIHCCTERIVF